MHTLTHLCVCTYITFYLSEILPLTSTAEFCADLWITVLLSVSSSMGPSMAINIFHQYLVRSWSFAGTGIFLAGLFTFLSRWPNVNQLRALGRNWFRTVVMTMKNKTKNKSEFSALSSATLHWAAKSGQAHIQMNGGGEGGGGRGRREVIQLEPDTGHELPLTPGWQLSESKLVCSDNWLGTIMWDWVQVWPFIAFN